MDALPRRLPLVVKLACTLFVAAMVICYWPYVGPANFLWLCDIALFTTVAALWLESCFLASMALVATFLPQSLWLGDFAMGLVTGAPPLGITRYMFRAEVPLWFRLISLFHGWLLLLLLGMVSRLGYDRRGWLVQSLVAWVVLLLCYCFTDPSRNLNAVWGLSADHPQTWVSPPLYLVLVMLVYPCCFYLPTHLLLRWVFRTKPAPDSTQSDLRSQP